MNIKKTVKSLTESPGISGFEGAFAKEVCEALGKFCPDAHVTKTNSVVGTVRSKKQDAPTVLIEAHLDRVGLIVSSVDENGFAGFRALGGIDERILPGAEVRILGERAVYGIIGAKPPHLMEKGEDEKGLDVKDMLIDTSLDGGTLKEVVKVGDPILLCSEFCELLDGKISSAALDNRAGMAAVFGFLEKIRGKDIGINLKIAFTSGEEMGLLGAYTIVGDEKIDLAVVIDVTYGSTPDGNGAETFPLGSGVAVCRGPNVDFDYTNRMMKIAEDNGISFEIEVASGSTGTNAWAIQISGEGVPCVVLSIPLRYMHTTVETVCLSDIESLTELLFEALCGGDLFA